MRRHILALLATATIGCGEAPPPPAASPAPREGARPAGVRLDNEVQATAYEAKIAKLSCEELFERAERMGDEWRALEPRAFLGGVQGAVVKRALACDGPLPALLVIRYLPYVVQRQYGAKTAVAAYTSLSTPETRPRALSALRTLLQTHDSIEGTPAGGDDWWPGPPDAFRPEDVIAPTCAELDGLRPGGEKSYRMLAALAVRRKCDAVLADTMRWGMGHTSNTRRAACTHVRDAKLAGFGNAAARAAANDRGNDIHGMGSVQAGPILVPVQGPRERTEYPGRAACEPLAISLGGFVMGKRDAKGLAVWYYGAPKAFLLASSDEHGVMRPGYVAGTSLGGAELPAEVAAALPKGAKVIALGLQEETSDVSPFGPHRTSALDAGGALTPRPAGVHRFWLIPPSSANGGWVRLFAVERDGRVVAGERFLL